MSGSLNLQFDTPLARAGERDVDPGEAIAGSLREGVRASGWEVGQVEDWRDGGRVLDCRRPADAETDAVLQVVLAATAPGSWMLQVAPRDVPGFLGRLLGRAPSAGRDEVLDLARVVHAALAAQPGLGRWRWRWDGFPDDGATTPEPEPWTGR